MNTPTKLTIFGTDHEEKGEIYSQALDSENVTLATSAGVTSKPNEDAAGVSVSGSEMVLAIADGHWGRNASEIAILTAVDLLGPGIQPSTENQTRARLFSLFEQVNDQLYELATSAPGASTPETTLIVCHVKEVESSKYLYWASFGDSYLFLLRNEKLKQLNSLNPRWLGYLSKLSEKTEARAILMRFLTDEARYVGVASGLETGIENLESSDIVFLCTDGLVGSDTKPDPAVLYQIKMLLSSNLPFSSKVEKTIASALDRGEKDNITCLAALIP
jgi:serine/threonine protein phosphatase PrpC